MTGLLLVLSGLGLAWLGARSADREAADLDRRLDTTASNAAVLMADQFERAVAADLQLAAVPAFARFYQAPGSLDAKVRANGPDVRDAQNALAFIENLFPGAVSEACFIDLATGVEIARVVDGDVAPVSELSPDETGAVFFAPTSEQPIGVPYQSVPYESEDTGQWVTATATVVEVDDQRKALVHFETSIESLRQLALTASDDAVRVIDAVSGTVVIDNHTAQDNGMALGLPDDNTFVGESVRWTDSGNTTIDGDRMAYAVVPDARTLKANNANDWYVAASAPAVATGLTAAVSPLVVAMLALGLPLLLLAVVGYIRSSRRSRAQRVAVQEDRDLLEARMTEMTGALDLAASGDLAVQLDVDFGDERMTAMARAFDRTLAHLRTLVSQAQESSMQLSQAAGELRATATQQASSASEQSAAVTETSTTIEELAATAAQIADTAGSVATSAQQTMRFTEDGLSAVRDSVAAMDRLSGKVEFIAASSAGLGEKVGEIGRILSLIDELSEQTNLLALNAAIEAARAGEHGRGFAVVAAEVRKLAERAQQSTAQIQALVTEIQAHTRSTVLASEEGAREAHQGSSVAQLAADALDRIAGQVDDTTTAVEEISIATQQQRSASEQVVSAMAQVSEVTRQYAVGSRQAASAAQDIAAMADSLDAAIATFRTDESQEQASRPASMAETSHA